MTWNHSAQATYTDPPPQQHTSPAATPNDPPTDRDYQLRGVRAIVDGLRGGGRGQLLMACGTGKTKMALWAAERLVSHGGVVVIAVPTVGLVAQTLGVWAEEHRSHRALAVCADTSVREQTSAQSQTNADDEFGDVEDITDPVTTDPDMVDAWLRTPGTTAIRLIVVTHASSHVVGEGLQKARVAADLLVVDEAHRSAGAPDKHTALVHDDDVLPAHRRLYMTATPRVLQSHSSGVAACSMDDQRVFGPALFTYPFSAAIADGWLDDYQVAVIGVTHADILTLLRDTTASSGQRGTRRQSTLHTAAVQTALARAAAEFDLRRVIAFCPRVEDAKRFATTFPQTLQALPSHLRPQRPLTASHVSGAMSIAQRRRVMAALTEPPAQGWTVISNAKCLSEGIDVPAVDGIAFTAPKKSTIDIVQAVGRALRRTSDGAGKATIIVPVLLPAEHANDDEFDAGAYEVLWEVVRALRAHDDAFADALDRCRASGFQLDGVMDRFRIRLPDHFHTPQFLEYLTIRLVTAASSHWWVGYQELVKYHLEFGHTRVKITYISDNKYKLGQWVSKTRQAYSQGRLGPDRVDALNRIGFIANALDAFWEANLVELSSFHAQHGHLDVPPELASAYGTSIREALRQYRAQQRKGTLRPDRMAALEELGVVWEPREEFRAQMIDFLREYRVEHGHIAVENGAVTPQGANVALWLTRSRKLRAAGELSDEDIAELDDLGMVWDGSRCRWERQTTSVRRYYAAHGTIAITAEEAEPDSEKQRIRRLLANLRSLRRNGKLDQRKIDDLDAMGFDWEETRPSWQRYYAEAVRYHANNGHLNVDADYVSDTGVALGQWLAKQLSRQFFGKLSAQHVAELEALGVIWRTVSASDEAWARAVTELGDHCRRTRVTPDDIRQGDKTANGRAIGQWLKVQNRLYAKGELAPERARILAEHGVTFRTPTPRKPKPVPPRKTPVDPWDRQIALLRRAFEHSKPVDPRSDTHRNAVVLLALLRGQRDQGSLPQDRAAAIEEILPDWEVSHATTRERVAAARRYFQRHGHLLPPEGFVDDQGVGIYGWLSRQRALRAAGKLTEAYITKLNAVGMVWDVEQAYWECGLAALAEFQARTGHCRVSLSWTYLNPRRQSRHLNSFTQKQREQYRAGQLEPDRVAALDRLGFDWNPLDTQWDVKLAALRKFREQHGHLVVPHGYQVDDLDVGTAIAALRRDHATGALASERVAALENLGMIWDPKSAAWQEMIEFLRSYHAQHGHIRIPKTVRAPLTLTDEGHPTRGNDVPVAPWLWRQRAQREAGDLTAEQIADLDALGMDWGKRAQDRQHWHRLFLIAQKYFSTHGHLTVTAHEARDDHDVKTLYNWLGRLRIARESGRLDEDRIAALDAIGMQWTAPHMDDVTWMTKFTEVKEFRERHGRFPRKKEVAENQRWSLGSWLAHQRALQRQGKLAPQRRTLLTGIGIDFQTQQERAWTEAITRLAAYRSKGRDPNKMPRDTPSPDGFCLYNWLSRARRLAASNKLSNTQISDLVQHGVKVNLDE